MLPERARRGLLRALVGAANRLLAGLDKQDASAIAEALADARHTRDELNDEYVCDMSKAFDDVEACMRAVSKGVPADAAMPSGRPSERRWTGRAGTSRARSPRAAESRHDCDAALGGRAGSAGAPTDETQRPRLRRRGDQLRGRKLPEVQRRSPAHAVLGGADSRTVKALTSFHAAPRSRRPCLARSSAAVESTGRPCHGRGRRVVRSAASDRLEGQRTRAKPTRPDRAPAVGPSGAWPPLDVTVAGAHIPPCGGGFRPFLGGSEMGHARNLSVQVLNGADPSSFD